LARSRAIDSRRQTLNGMRIERCEAEPQGSRNDKTGMRIEGAGCSRSREGGRLGS
jgi:hypothetical protein